MRCAPVTTFVLLGALTGAADVAGAHLVLARHAPGSPHAREIVAAHEGAP